jgi:hypothetical protein
MGAEPARFAFCQLMQISDPEVFFLRDWTGYMTLVRRGDREFIPLPGLAVVTATTVTT